MAKKIVEAMKETNNIKNYDFRLVTISIKEIDEDNEEESRVLEIRCRREQDADEELVIVAAEKGLTKAVEDIDEDLKALAGIIEAVTEGLVGEFPDKVLVWNWLGD